MSLPPVDLPNQAEIEVLCPFPRSKTELDSGIAANQIRRNARCFPMKRLAQADAKLFFGRQPIYW